MSKKKNSDAVNESVNEQQDVAAEPKKTKKETPQTPDIKVGPAVAARGARKREAEEADPGEQIQTAIGRTERFIYNNAKMLLTILGALILISLVLIWYFRIHKHNQSDKAGAMLFVAEQQFANNEFETALNGDGNNPGLLDVIDQYGATNEGNMAKFYAGVSYFKMGDYDNALKFLHKYKETKGAPNQIVNALNKGLQGDIHVQKEEYDKAAKMFEEAVNVSSNSFTTPLYLKKLALVYSEQGKHEKSAEALERIIREFPTSMQAYDAEKFLGAEKERAANK